jgi:hypothetical protein
MPRFNLASLLIVIAVVALWLSTFTAYTGADDVRAFIMLAIVFASGAAAVYSTGAKRAFWGGFFAGTLAMGSRTTFFAYSPRLTWLNRVSADVARRFPDGGIPQWKHNSESIQASLYLLTWLVMATILGLICLWVYWQFHKSPISSQ